MSEGPFRVYVVDEHGAARCKATCDDDSLGFCLLTLQEEGEFGPLRVGIMHRPDPDETGQWIVNPYGGRLEC